MTASPSAVVSASASASAAASASASAPAVSSFSSTPASADASAAMAELKADLPPSGRAAATLEGMPSEIWRMIRDHLPPTAQATLAVTNHQALGEVLGGDDPHARRSRLWFPSRSRSKWKLMGLLSRDDPWGERAWVCAHCGLMHRRACAVGGLPEAGYPVLDEEL
ncbi:hypothetical protein BU16DRAFT_543432 [Lophium mytilinum]|uniref:F-box domain-containing protein n=1 Tax=Lophium mytilinum TaxID=390894 RepID=A0A6A6QI97_9PEZI|nr:hypothetical protein BU16DRAFT_543432 [Lophium mytilinum]